MVKNQRLLEIDNSIQEKYLIYKDLFSKIAVLTKEISDLEEERTSLIEKDGRRLLFKKPAIELRDFNIWAKNTKWCNTVYENFEELEKKHIVKEAMIVAIYSYQSNYMSPVDIIISLEGYLSQEEYDKIRLSNNRLPEYYVENQGDINGRTKI